MILCFYLLYVLVFKYFVCSILLLFFTITGVTIFPPRRKVHITFQLAFLMHLPVRLPVRRPLDFVREQAFQKQKWMFGYRISELSFPLYTLVAHSRHRHAPPLELATAVGGPSQTLWALGDLAGHGGVLMIFRGLARFTKNNDRPRFRAGLAFPAIHNLWLHALHIMHHL